MTEQLFRYTKPVSINTAMALPVDIICVFPLFTKNRQLRRVDSQWMHSSYINQHNYTNFTITNFTLVKHGYLSRHFRCEFSEDPLNVLQMLSDLEWKLSHLEFNDGSFHRCHSFDFPFVVFLADIHSWCGCLREFSEEII